MPYRVYIFDFDFTLADATEGIVESTNSALIRMNLPQNTREEIRGTVGQTLTEMFVSLTGETTPDKAALFVQYFKEKADLVMTDSTVFFSDTLPFLTALKQRGCQIAMVTSKMRYRIIEVLEKHHMMSLFDYLVGVEDVVNAKPAPEGLLKAIAHLGASPQEVLYIGDSLIDARTAQSAGIDFAAVTTGTTTAADFQTLPHVRIASCLSELG